MGSQPSLRALARLVSLLVFVLASSCAGEIGDAGDGISGAEARRPSWNGPTCGPRIVDRLSVNTLSGRPSGGLVFGAATSTGNTVLAWSDSNYVTHVTEIGPTGASVRDLRFSETGSPQGLAVSDTQFGLLIGSEFGKLYMILIDRASGATVFTKDMTDERYLYPEYDPAVYGWVLGHHLRPAARIAWVGSAWAVYWGKEYVHQGDELVFFAPDGTYLPAGSWGWGCSHSNDMRIAYNGERAAPVCLADWGWEVYADDPTNGYLCSADAAGNRFCPQMRGFNLSHATATLYKEPTGTYGSGYVNGSRFGGLVGVPGGYWMSFASREGRASRDVAVLRFASTWGEGGVCYTTRAYCWSADAYHALVGEPIWLTSTPDVQEDLIHLGTYRSGLLVAWASSFTGPYYLAELDGAGAMVGAPEQIPAAFNGFQDQSGIDMTHHADFFTYPDGSTGWAYIEASRRSASLKLARVNGACP